MRHLKDVVAYEVAKRYVEKRAGSGFWPAVGVGALGKHNIDEGVDEYRDDWRKLENANKLPLGSPIPSRHAKHAAAGAPPANPSGFMGNLVAGLTGFKPNASGDPTPNSAAYGGAFSGGLLGNAASGIAGGVGKGLYDSTIGKWLAPKPGFMERKDVAGAVGQDAVHAFSKGLSEAGMSLLKDMASKVMHMGDDSAREAILKQLRMEDPVLAEADDKVLMEAYHTMVRFAPTLSTDKNAVRSFLRAAVMSGSGLDFATIKMISEAERTVSGKGDKDGHH